MKPAPLAALAATLLCLGGCYRFAGRNFEDVETVGIKVFVNRTLYRDVDFQLTDALRREISATTMYLTDSPGKADAVIEGEVLDYREPAETIDEREEVAARQLVAVASYKLVDARSGEVLAGPGRAEWNELYRVRTGRSLAEVREETFRKLAHKIVQEIFLPWPEKRAAPAGQQQE